MKKVVCWIVFGLVAAVVQAPKAEAKIELAAEIRQKILDRGVPEKSLDRILGFINANSGTELTTEIYTCPDKPEYKNPVQPCGEDERTRTSKKILIKEPKFVISIDFSKPSDQRRMYFIDLESGGVDRYFTTHGKGSGKTRWAYKFSNIKDSNQSSLGLYRVGEVYKGKYGDTIRLYGLEGSNDQAYNRDIVLHSADYAKEDFISTINSDTGKPFGRLGLSWGCPAVAPDVRKHILPYIKENAILDIYHSELMEAALTGKEVQITPPEN